MTKTIRKDPGAKPRTSKPKPGSKDAIGSGVGVVDLEKVLRHLASSKAWEVSLPLPTTRSFGEQYAISNASVCRVLIRLNQQGVIWRRDNGRYYLNESRRLFERRKPYACLLRKLQNWSRIYQAIMSGFSQAFGRDQASMLFMHNESLVRHADTAHPPIHAGAAAQRESLVDFFRNHEKEFGGMLFDEVWLDDVLAEFPNEIGHGVVVCRPSTLPFLSSVSVDFDSAALLAIGHLYARGFEEIWLALPFANSIAVDLMAQAARKASALLGKPIVTENLCVAATPADRERLVARVRATKARIGVFCLEDNVSTLLWESFAAAGIACPARVGLLSGMGTDIVIDRKISSLKINFETIGRTAGEILVAGKKSIVTLPTELSVGTST